MGVIELLELVFCLHVSQAFSVLFTKCFIKAAIPVQNQTCPDWMTVGSLFYVIKLKNKLIAKKDWHHTRGPKNTQTLTSNLGILMPSNDG